MPFSLPWVGRRKLFPNLATEELPIITGHKLGVSSSTSSVEISMSDRDDQVSRRMKTFFTALKALLYLVAALLFFGWMVFRVRRLDFTLGILPTWTEIPGFLFVVAGGALLVLCFGTFVVRGLGTPLPLDPPTKLVALGPYKYVRNPIHIAWVTLFIGLGLYLHSPSILLFALAFLGICYVYVLCVEEPSLKKRFGTEYEEYCKIVPRYVPRLNPSKQV